LVVVDHYSRYLQAYAARDLTCATTIKLLKRWVTTFGAPDCVLTDRGSAFGSEFTEFVTEALGAYHTWTSAYYPQGNGVNESSHRSLGHILRAMATHPEAESPFPSKTLSEKLDLVALIYNSSPHTSIGSSPYQRLFGFEVTLPGWQHMRDVETDRSVIHRDHYLRRLMLKAFVKEPLPHDANKQIRAGDLIIFRLGEYEKRIVEVAYAAQ